MGSNKGYRVAALGRFCTAGVEERKGSLVKVVKLEWGQCAQLHHKDWPQDDCCLPRTVRYVDLPGFTVGIDGIVLNNDQSQLPPPLSLSFY